MARYPTYLPLIGLALITLLSRLPFLSPGYGTDPDAARMVLAARHLAETGEYMVSRFPGYPVVEIALSLPAGSPAWALNLLTALISVAAVVLFALIARDLDIRHYRWLGAALAFTPVVYIHSVDTMDYLWALTFLLLSTWLTLRSRPTAAGIALGLAIGCRLTSGLMFIPLAFLLYQGRKNLPAAGKFTLAAGLTAFVAFLPVMIEYGFSFFAYYDGSYPRLLSVAKSLSLSLFGRMGLWALVIAVLGLCVWPRQFRISPDTVPTRLLQFQRVALLAVALWLALFLWMPAEPGYLIPAIPFLLLVLSRWIRPQVFAVVTLVLAIGSFGEICRSQGVCRAGILADHRERARTGALISGVLAQAASLPDSSLVAAAWWRPFILVSAPDSLTDRLQFIYLLDSAQLSAARSRGLAVYYLPGIEEFNAARGQIRLEQVGAKPLDISR